MNARSAQRKSAVASLRNEVVAVVLFGMALLLLLSLVSYDPRDGSWNTAGPEREAQSNWIGSFGAYIADFFLQWFGLASFAIPPLLIMLGWRSFFARNGAFAARKAVGSVLLLVALSGFLALFPDVEVAIVENSRNGGAIGYLVEGALAGLMNTTGAAIVLAVAAVLTVMLTMEVSLTSAWDLFKHRTRGSARPSRSAMREGGFRRAFLRLRGVWERLKKRRPERPRPVESAIRNAGLPAVAEQTAGVAAPAEPAELVERVEITPTLRARAAAADQVTMDPEVAEMVSTASIVRTVTQPPKPQRRSFQSTHLESTYILPSIDLLDPPIGHHEEAEEELRERATVLAEKCKEFAVTGHIHRINPGPVVTTFEFKPDPGIKYSRIVSLSDDLCLALKAESIRIDRIPGKSTVGIEVPNSRRERISLREVIESPRFHKSESRLTTALGETINGEVHITDLAKMPHLLIAGATGAGKSVTLNAIICSILYKATPEEVKFIMVDPKRLELGLYEGIPHLLTPIVTDPKRAANALKWAINEMERRYRELAKFGVRNIDQYNSQVREFTQPTLWEDDPNAPRHLPYIVITIDELADLMMISRGEVETSIARLAQMARAVGIHLVVATQRPSVDIITGVIKANFPSRIAFRVSSKVDSRTIIDANGAEALLGQGDMLFLPPASSRLIRVHGSLVNEAEIKRITDHARKQARPAYNEQVTMNEQEAEGVEDFSGERDDLYDEAIAIVTDMGRASTSVLQRRLSIGYGRAAKILDTMEREGLIGPADGAKPRKVLPLAYEFRERLDQQVEELS